MIWNHPAALAGLALLALPVLVHLLVRRHAARVLFPAARFVPAVRAAAVRLRAPSDRALLALRLAVVAAAALAAAQPVLNTNARRRAWDARVATAVIVDTSPSVPADLAARLGERAAAGAFAAHTFASPDVRDAVRRAADWLADAPAARRRVVIVSDFQRGAIHAADLAGVPASIGVDVLRAGPPRAAGSNGAPIDGWRGGRWTGAMTLDAAKTQMAWSRSGAAEADGLTVRGAGTDREAIARAVAAARSFGVPAAAATHRVDVAFAGAAAITDVPPVTPGIASAAIALHRSTLLAETETDVQVGERDGVMAVRTTLPAGSPFAPAVIRAALLAASPSLVDREAETATLGDGELARWKRTGAPVGSAMPQRDESDGRWFWAAALVLLIAESLARRRGSAVREGAPARPRAASPAGGTHADAA